jgi:hypothetical protein
MTHQTKQLLGYSLLIKIVFLVVLWIFQPLFPINKQMAENNLFYYASHAPFLNLFVPWDSQWFLSIADSGYTSTPHFAFYPLYPMLIKGIHQLIPFLHPILIGLLLSNGATIAAIYFLDTFIPSNKLAARYTLATLVVLNPSSIFFSSVYSESLFLLTSVYFWYSLQRQQYARAGFALFAAGFTRSIGVILIIPLITTLIQRKCQIKQTLYLLFMYGVGNFLFPILSVIATHNSHIYLDAQAAFSRNPPSLLQLATSLSGYFHFFSLPYHSFQQSQLDLLWCLVITCLILMMIKYRERWDFIIYSGCTLIIPLLSGTTMSLIRMTAIAFPLYLFLSRIAASKPWLQYSVIALSTMMALGAGILYCHWYWVA